MNSKNNLRFQQTERKIRDIFLELLKKKELSKITVREICCLANINRTTFYLHHEDIYGLMQCIDRICIIISMRFLPPPEKNIVSGNVFCNYFLLLKNIRIFTGYFCPASIDPVFLTMRCYPYPISGFRNSCVSLRSIVFQNMNTARHFSLPD